MRTAVITIAHGRAGHLALQEQALARSDRAPDVRVVVAMDDAALVSSGDVVHVPRMHGALPLAAARNAGVARARALGAELLVLLDVDCLPSRQLLDRYLTAARSHGGLLCGPVGYLPPAPASGYALESVASLAVPHAARPVPPEESVLAAPDPDLFWSLSFALTASTWDRVGGFCEDFYGYGGEDTDFGHAASRAGVPMWWVGGAWAFHQHHGGGGTPVQHRDDIVRNATVFHRRWGWWPMQGWLDDLADQGLVRRSESGDWVAA